MEVFDKVFAKDLSELECTEMVQHWIDIMPNLPLTWLKQQPYANQEHCEFIQVEINQMIANNIIEPALSQYGAPVVIVGKKNGKQRFCVDYWELNKITQDN